MDGAFGFCKSDQNISIAHLDYKYIEKCSDSKEIEKLLKILRSGEEGSYPDLVRFTEDRLTSLNPKSKLLLQENLLKGIKDVGKDEGNSLIEDLKSWSEQMTMLDNSIKKASDNSKTDSSFPPIRSTQMEKENNPTLVEEKSTEVKQSKRVLPRSYGDWEKVDVEQEVAKVDSLDVTKKENARRNRPVLDEAISSEGIPKEERPNRAISEKDKGNEAFKAGDFEESIVYYNRSLSIHPVITVYNNRAIAYIKLNKYEDAIKDCNKVLANESDNIKALLRRGIAMKVMKRYSQAKEDFSNVLLLAPENKRAKGLLEEVLKLIAESSVKASGDSVESKGFPTGESPHSQQQSKPGRRLIIEEIHGSEKPSEIPRKEDHLKQETTNKGKRLKIVEADEITDTDMDVTDAKREGNSTAGVMPEKDKGPAAKSSKEETKAEETTSAAITSPPVITPPKPLPKHFVRLTSEGYEFYDIGRYAEAIDKFTEALNEIDEDEPSYATSIAVLLSKRSACRSKIGDCRGCIDDASASITLMSSADAFLQRARAYEALEKYRLAYADYQAACNLDPSLLSAREAGRRLVTILKDQNGKKWRDELPKTEKSEMPVNQSTGNNVTVDRPEQANVPDATLRSKSETETKSQASSVDGEGNSRRTETREEKFKRVKEIGNKLVQQGKYADAADCYTQCMDLIPDEAVSYTNRAMCYLKLNKPNKADADCTNALLIQANNVKALYRRAMARKTVVRYEDAIEDLNKLLKVDPSNSAAKKELEIIKNLLKKEMDAKDSKLRRTTANKRNKVLIEEVNAKQQKEGCSSQEMKSRGNVKNSKEDESKEVKRKGKKLKIVEVDEYEDENKEKIEDKVEEKSIDQHLNDIKIEQLTTKTSVESESSTDLPHVSSTASISETLSDGRNISSVELEIPEEVARFKDEGNLLYKQGRYADAIECYTKAINLISQDEPSYASPIAVLLSNRSACRSKIGDCRGCIDDANASLKLMPSAKALLRRAHAYEALEKYRNAYVDYQSVLRVDRNVKSAWDASTRIMQVLKDLDGPKWRDKLPRAESFSNLIKQEKRIDSGATMTVAGEGGAGIEGRSRNIHEQAGQTGKSDVEAKNSRQDSKITQSEVKKEEVEVKKKERETKKKGETKDVETKEDKFKRIKDLGNSFVQQEKYQDALNYYSQCIDLLPGEVASYTNRALCYLKLNKAKKAIADCSKALDMQPNNTKALFRRALAKKACGKFMEALQDLTSLLKIEPHNPAASKELETVKSLWREELKNTQAKGSDGKKTSTETASELKQKLSSKSKASKSDEVSRNRDGSGQKESSAGQSSPRKMNYGAKKATKDSQKSAAKKISGFEFLQAWSELKGKDLKEHAELLMQVEPTQLPKVLSNKIDGDMIETIVSCVHEYFFVKDKLLLGFNILRHMSKAERFNMAVMFLSTNGLSKIRRVVEELDSKLKDSNSAVTAKEISDLKRSYKLSMTVQFHAFLDMRNSESPPPSGCGYAETYRPATSTALREFITSFENKAIRRQQSNGKAIQVSYFTFSFNQSIKLIGNTFSQQCSDQTK
eukprot:gene11962-13199_t